MTVQQVDRPKRTLVERSAALLDRGPSRRSFLVRTAVVGSALTMSPLSYLLRPGTAYAAVCGIDSACSSGYTVFCCTVNNGVNACPPGSLVGGWWKSDGSGYCCGNARYYIDCHSYCSCGCENGRNFCGEGCRNCSCGCGPGGQCDQRRVCCNNFRYGQCNQHVSCTGPVWCRVVTCTPPWQVPAWSCTTTSASDQRTNDHGAPCLDDCSAIGRKYTALGGPGSVLGEPITGERELAGGGRYNAYAVGSIYWHQTTGAWSVRGAIRDAWQRLGWEAGALGYPVTDELVAPDGAGRYNTFARGSIYWHPSTGAHGIWGEIRARWGALGWEAGPLGYPTTDELTAPDGVGRFNGFARGSIYWHPSTGAHGVWGEIRATWAKLGSEAGQLGYPLTDETATSDGAGRYNDFVGGSVFWHPSTGAHAIWGEIKAKWRQLGAQAGVLGYPVTSETATPDRVGRYNVFTGGSVYWHPTTGAFSMRGDIRDRWAQLGWEAGVLGYPVSDQIAVSGGGSRNEFVGPGTPSAPAASIYSSPATGAHSVSGPVRRAWLDRGGATGTLGFPTSEPYRDADGRTRSDFQRGHITHDPATGVVVVTQN